MTRPALQWPACWSLLRLVSTLARHWLRHPRWRRPPRGQACITTSVSVAAFASQRRFITARVDVRRKGSVGSAGYRMPFSCHDESSATLSYCMRIKYGGLFDADRPVSRNQDLRDRSSQSATAQSNLDHVHGMLTSRRKPTCHIIQAFGP